MELYTKTAYELSRQLTLRYSTSFSTSSRFFAKDIQPHIFAIYGLVRVADETVDTYEGKNRKELLSNLEQETYTAIKTGYSTNPVVHAFARTAKQFGITKTLIKPFFKSMRLDLTPQTYTPKLYEIYIYGSAEVIGLMCLKVFVQGNDRDYKKLEAGAKALGSAYQKVNFLRDFASDYNERGRVYFPGVAFENFNTRDKNRIIKDIQKDFTVAKKAVNALPIHARKAVKLSYVYYYELLKKLEITPAEIIKVRRIRVSNIKKLALLAKQGR
ncbi:MAG: squalene/phytoene synthase family protein [Candidatus Microsaccharimonas sp.]